MGVLAPLGMTPLREALIDGDDGQPDGSGQRRHGDPISGALTNQGLADRRFARNAAGIEVDLGGLDDGVGLLAVFVPAHRDGGADGDNPRLARDPIDRRRSRQRSWISAIRRWVSVKSVSMPPSQSSGDAAFSRARANCRSRNACRSAWSCCMPAAVNMTGDSETITPPVRGHRCRLENTPKYPARRRFMFQTTAYRSTIAGMRMNIA